MKHLQQSLLLGTAVIVLAATTARASVIGYWRMEADDDATTGYSIANEIAGGNALTGGNGSVDSGSVPADPIPQTQAANLGSLNGSPDLNGTISRYAALDADSISVEFWARTNEGIAEFVARQDGDTGLRILEPNSVWVEYSTETRGQVSLSTGHDFGGDWDHFAFTYDRHSGLGRAFVNGTQVASNSGSETPGEALTWPAVDMLVGNGMDGGSPFSGNDEGLLDELKISNIALTPRKFLNAADVGTLANAGFSQAGQFIPDETKTIVDHGPRDTWLLTDDGAGGGEDQWRIENETLVLNQEIASEAQAAIQWVPDNRTTEQPLFLRFDLDWDDNDLPNDAPPGEIDLRAYVFGWNEGDAVPSVDAQNGVVGAGDEFDLAGGTNLLAGLSGDSPFLLIENNTSLVAGLSEGDGFDRLYVPLDFQGQTFDYLGVMFYGEAANGASFVIDNVQMVVPEPSALAMCLLGFFGLIGGCRRKRA